MLVVIAGTYKSGLKDYPKAREVYWRAPDEYEHSVHAKNINTLKIMPTTVPCSSRNREYKKTKIISR